MTCIPEYSISSVGTAVFLARLRNASNEYITQSEISSISYTIFEDPTNTSLGTPVTGHSSESITISSSVFDTLQTDAVWESDGIGYNFKHTPPTSVNYPFPNRGSEYVLRYIVLPISEEPLVFQYKIYAV